MRNCFECKICDKRNQKNIYIYIWKSAFKWKNIGKAINMFEEKKEKKNRRKIFDKIIDKKSDESVNQHYSSSEARQNLQQNAWEICGISNATEQSKWKRRKDNIKKIEEKTSKNSVQFSFELI